MTYSARKTVERMYVLERKNPLYIANSLDLDVNEVESLTALLIRMPIPNSRPEVVAKNKRDRERRHNANT